MIVACHNCRIGPSNACLTCRRVDQDDIRIRHTPHNRAEYQAAAERPAGGRATELPDGVEDKLRRFLFDLFDLDPVQLLMLRHVRNGGTPVSFGAAFARFLKSSIKYGDRARRGEWERAVEGYGAHVGRATAKAIWDGMVRKLPLLTVFQSWDKGHGGRQAEEQDEPRCVQMEMDFGTSHKTPKNAPRSEGRGGTCPSGGTPLPRAPRGVFAPSGAIPRGVGTVKAGGPTPNGRD